MSEPKSVFDILSDRGEAFTATEESDQDDRRVVIWTLTPVEDRTKDEIEQSASWYGGPVKIVYKVGDR